jgi:hypothetical protein
MSFNELEALIDEFPLGMTDLYENLLARENGRDKFRRMVLLQCVLFATRPLSLRAGFILLSRFGQCRFEDFTDEEADVHMFKTFVKNISGGLA